MWAVGRRHGRFSSPQPLRQPADDAHSRAVLGAALRGLLYAVVSNQLRAQAMPLFRAAISQLTILALFESTTTSDDEGEDNKTQSETTAYTLSAGCLLVDAISAALADPCIEFNTAATSALCSIDSVARALAPDNSNGAQRVYALPFFGRLFAACADLCYRRDWYARLGGCTAIRQLLDQAPASFALAHAGSILQAMFTVSVGAQSNGDGEMSDDETKSALEERLIRLFTSASLQTIAGLANEISSGAVDIATSTLHRLVDLCLDELQTRAAVDASAAATERSRIVRLAMSLIAENLAHANAQLRAETERFFEHLVARANATRAELLADERATLQRTLERGLFEFSSATIATQNAFLVSDRRLERDC